jgi:hypothetical protein
MTMIGMLMLVPMIVIISAWLGAHRSRHLHHRASSGELI